MAQSTGEPRGSNDLPHVGRRGAAALSGIVVLEFGPRSTTRGLRKALVKMARSLDVPVHAVEAFDVNSGRARGTAGRIDALMDDVATGAVLFVHDDVCVERASLDRLVDAHLAGATLVVPRSNDKGTDHFHGSLPPAGIARAELKRLAVSDPATGTGTEVTSPVTVISPSCLVTDRDTLVSLLDQRLHDPFTKLSDRDTGFHVVDSAYAAHEGVCGAQVRASGVTLDRPVLVASMIVKDEEAMLPECLASLEGVVDRIEVVDTGSSDRTVEIALAAGASVTEVEWRDDFSWARNAAADQCRDSAYTLWIDADERLVVPDRVLVRELLSAYSDDVEAYDIAISNRSDDVSDAVTSMFRARRIVRSDMLAFAGRIHEMPVRRGAPSEPFVSATFDMVTIDHLGYAEAVVERQDKRQRNLRLARVQHGDDDSIKASLDLARSLMLAGDDSDEAIELMRAAVTAAEGTKPQWMAYLLGCLSHLLMNAGQLQEAHTLAARGHSILATDDLASAVFVTTALQLGHEEALVAAFDPIADGVGEPVFRSPENERVIAAGMATAMARAGSAADAWASVCEWRDDGVVFGADEWTAVAEAAGRLFEGMEFLEMVLPVVADNSPAHGLVSAAADLISPDSTALLAVAVLAAGPLVPDAVSTGLVASIVAESWLLFDELSPLADALDADIRDRLAAHLDAKGQLERADSIRATRRSGSGLVAGFGGSRD